MRAVTIDDRGEPRIGDLPAAAVARGELVLRMTWSGLCGTDLFKLATGSAPAGAVLGHEVVGVVTALGEGVAGFAAGDRIVVPHHVACGACRDCADGAETQCAAFRENLLAPGGFAEEILVRARAVASAARRIPETVSDLDALFLEPAACVLRSLRKSAIFSPAPGAGSGARRVAAILGGGSMGLLHLLVLRAMAIPLVVVLVDPRPDRRELALDCGADSAVAPGPELLAAVRDAASDGRGADAVFDCVGGAALAGAALAALRPGATAVLFAHGKDSESAGFALNDLFKSEKRLVGAYSGSLAEQSGIWDLLCAGSLRPARLVTHRLPLDRFADGLDLARAQRALKVAFHP